jgi:hypothetical protein
MRAWNSPPCCQRRLAQRYAKITAYEQGAEIEDLAAEAILDSGVGAP